MKMPKLAQPLVFNCGKPLSDPYSGRLVKILLKGEKQKPDFFTGLLLERWGNLWATVVKVIPT